MLALAQYQSETLKYNTIFKSGDDLRQDSLTLKVMEIMMRLFKENGLNLPMIVYDCVCTGGSQGFIEAVQGEATKTPNTKEKIQETNQHPFLSI